MTAKTYLGKPCPKGHKDNNNQCLRYLSNGNCLACTKDQKLKSQRLKAKKPRRNLEYLSAIKANRQKAIDNGDRHFLGGLCERGHDYNGTGFSLRRPKNTECIECKNLMNATRKRLDGIVIHTNILDSIPDNFMLGQLCRRGHDYNGTGFSLRRVCNKCCVECSRASAIEYEKNRPPRKHSSYDIEIPQIPKPINHGAMTEDYKNRTAAIKRLEYQLKKEMAI
jgi:hypothetical protein